MAKTNQKNPFERLGIVLDPDAEAPIGIVKGCIAVYRRRPGEGVVHADARRREEFFPRILLLAYLAWQELPGNKTPKRGIGDREGRLLLSWEHKEYTTDARYLWDLINDPERRGGADRRFTRALSGTFKRVGERKTARIYARGQLSSEQFFFWTLEDYFQETGERKLPAEGRKILLQDVGSSPSLDGSVLRQLVQRALQSVREKRRLPLPGTVSGPSVLLTYREAYSSPGDRRRLVLDPKEVRVRVSPRLLTRLDRRVTSVVEDGQVLEDFLKSEDQILAILGDPGVGKPQLLIRWGEMVERRRGHKARFLDPQLFEPASVSRLPVCQTLVLFVDEAGRFLALPDFLSIIWRANSESPAKERRIRVVLCDWTQYRRAFEDHTHNEMRSYRLVAYAA